MKWKKSFARLTEDEIAEILTKTERKKSKNTQEYGKERA